MIHVVHVITRTNIGGPSVMLVDLINEGDHERFRHTVIRGATANNEGDYLVDHPISGDVITLPSLKRSLGVFNELRSLFQVVRFLRLIRPDIVHTHMAKAGVVGRLAAWVARVPVRVHTYHGHLLYGYFSPVKTKVVVLIERLLGLITTHAVVVGSAVRRDLIDAHIVSDGRSSMIPPGISDVGRDTIADRCGAAPDKRLVGFVGRLTSIKRPDRFVDMARIVSADRHDVEFLIVGDGPLGDEVRSAVASLPTVHCVGWRREIAPVLVALDVLVLCSDNEGIPLTLIEAAQCGVAVVTTDVGSVRDVVEDGQTGLVTETTPEALAAAVTQLLDDPALRAKFGSAGRERALSAFGVETAQRRHRELYLRLVNAS